MPAPPRHLPEKLPADTPSASVDSYGLGHFLGQTWLDLDGLLTHRQLTYSSTPDLASEFKVCVSIMQS